MGNKSLFEMGQRKPKMAVRCIFLPSILGSATGNVSRGYFRMKFNMSQCWPTNIKNLEKKCFSWNVFRNVVLSYYVKI